MNSSLILQYLDSRGVRLSAFADFYACVDYKGLFLTPNLRVEGNQNNEFKARLDMAVMMPGGYMLIESFVAMDITPNGAATKAAHDFYQYCMQPIIMAMGGDRVNEKQVNVHTVTISGFSYKCYDAGLRVHALPNTPDPRFQEEVRDIADEFMRMTSNALGHLEIAGRFHTCRAFVGSVSGKLTSEFLQDSEPSVKFHNMFLDLQIPSNFRYLSLRYFQLLVRVDAFDNILVPKKQKSQKSGMFSSLFGKKKEESQEVDRLAAVSLEAAVPLAIEIMTSHGIGRDEEEVQEIMEASGIEAGMAERLIVFLPIVCVRITYPILDWPDKYILHDLEGKSEERNFKDSTFYMAIYEAVLKWKEDNREILLLQIVATRSAEYGILKQIIQSGQSPEKVPIKEMLIALFVD